MVVVKTRYTHCAVVAQLANDKLRVGRLQVRSSNKLAARKKESCSKEKQPFSDCLSVFSLVCTVVRLSFACECCVE